MRKNTARHWLHATLDLLPVILIPVFMIYSHRHTLTEQQNVDIQYKYESNEVTTVDDLVEGNIYKFNCENTTLDSYMNNGHLNMTILHFNEYNLSNYNLVIDDSVLDNYVTNGNIAVVLDISEYAAYLQIYFIDAPGNDYFISLDLGDFSSEDVTLNFEFILNYYDDLSIFSNLISYTDYNEIESVTVEDENVSITDAFMNNFNHTVNKYFNMGNVFNLKDVYHWFEVNIFNNQAPLVMESIYNIIVYEFIMDLLFLLYGLFMWFVDMCKRLMEKPLDSIK